MLSAFDLHQPPAGVGKALGLHSQTVPAVCDEYAKCGQQFGRPQLNWRGRKRWSVNFVCADLTPARAPTGKEAGVDLGLKTLATRSEGVALSRGNLTRQFEVRLAVAQRARKKKQAARMPARSKHKRKDWNHKATTLLTHVSPSSAVRAARPARGRKVRRDGE